MDKTEVKTLRLLHKTIKKNNTKGIIIDVRNILTRKLIDDANVPVLLVELPSGQNGTLTKYPGLGIGTTWLGKDGATVTLERGVLIASRGMGDDIMGGSNKMPDFNKIKGKNFYSRSLSYIEEDNKIKVHNFDCQIQKDKQPYEVDILNATHNVQDFIEICQGEFLSIRNSFSVDANNIVRKSYQYHGKTIGYIITERLDK